MGQGWKGAWLVGIRSPGGSPRSPGSPWPLRAATSPGLQAVPHPRRPEPCCQSPERARRGSEAQGWGVCQQVNGEGSTKKKKGPLPEASGPETFPHVIRLPAGRTRVQVRFYVLNRLAGVLGLKRRLRQRQDFLLGPRARASGPSACVPCRRGELGLGLGLGLGGAATPQGLGHRDPPGRVGGLPGCRCPTRSGGGVCGPSPRNTSESSRVTRLLWCEGSCGGDAACEASSRGCAFPTRAWVR